MALGRPKAGKTGLLVPALKAGFRVALLDWDGNPDPLRAFAPELHDRLSVVTLRDKLYRRADGTISALGKTGMRVEPQAFLRAGRALDDWGKLDPDHPWGPASTWGPDTILAFDSLTGCGDAAFRLAMFLNNRDVGKVRRQDWSSAMQLEDALLEDLVGPGYNCHLYVTAHLKLIGPKTEDDQDKDDDDLKEARHAIAKAQAENLPTRYYPTALGRALPQEILRRVPATILVDSTSEGRKVYTRPPVLAGQPMPIDLGVPGTIDGKPLPGALEHATAILDVMQAVCGYRSPTQGSTRP
jgi:hypothetical protein